MMANVQRIVTGDEERLVEQLREAARTKRLPAELDPAKLALETRSARIRDAAALALLDINHPQAADILVQLVAREDTVGHSGTLLYALDELGASVPTGILIDIIINDSYEARSEALFLLERSQANAAERAQAMERLSPLRRSPNEELAAAASEAIQILNRA